MRYGYVRVSTAAQNVARQVVKMEALGITGDALFVDRASGKDMDRPAWRELSQRLSAGDELVLDSIDRLGRNYEAVTAEWRRLTREVGCDVRALDLEFMDSARFREMGDVGRLVEDMVLNLLAWVAQNEREKIRSRQREGLDLAMAEGRCRGTRPRAVDPDVAAFCGRALAQGRTKVDVGRFLGVHANQVRVMLRDGRIPS